MYVTEIIIKIIDMKKYLILILPALAIGLTSCGTPQKVTLHAALREVVDYSVDYSKVTDPTFLISPYQYYGEYVGVGELRLVVVPAMKGEYAQDNSRIYGYFSESISYQELTRIAVEHAKKLGADGLVDFHIVRSERNAGPKAKNQCAFQYEMSGFCIKRK